jgi:hypothetical protein
MKRVKIILLCLFIFSFGTKTFAQLEPSIYSGFIIGRQINGTVPLGTELKYKQVSFETALIYIFETGFFQVHDFPQRQRIDFELGIKYHFDNKVFIGLNYGYLDGPHYKCGTAHTDNEVLKKMRGFTWSLGYRRSICKQFWLAGFAGITYKLGTEQYVDIGFFGPVTPIQPASFRGGVTLGYNLYKQ